MADQASLKVALRSKLRERRNALSPEEQLAASTAAARYMTLLPNWQAATRIALYQAADAELDPVFIAQQARSEDKLLFLPVIDGSGQLHFRAWQAGAPMTQNRFGIPEPTTGEAIAAAQLDILCLPLVGWDERGARLGMGGGYYDRALEGVSGPTRVGLGHECQRAEGIPLEHWDIRLDFVATGSRLYECQDNP